MEVGKHQVRGEQLLRRLSDRGRVRTIVFVISSLMWSDDTPFFHTTSGDDAVFAFVSCMLDIYAILMDKSIADFWNGRM